MSEYVSNAEMCAKTALMAYRAHWIWDGDWPNCYYPLEENWPFDANTLHTFWIRPIPHWHEDAEALDDLKRWLKRMRGWYVGARACKGYVIGFVNEDGSKRYRLGRPSAHGFSRTDAEARAIYKALLHEGEK